MNAFTPLPPAAPDPRLLLRELSAYRQPSVPRSVVELAVTAGPFLALWVAMLAAVKAGHLWALILALPAGLFLLRLFLIQHDCGHGAFFKSRAANDWTGRIIGVLTFTPYESWRRAHALHHAGTGKLEARGIGDIDTLTVAEFRALSPVRRILYRLYRNPIVLFGIGPAYMFLLRQRLPLGSLKCSRSLWVSALGTNAAIAALAIALWWLVGLQVLLLVHLPIVLIAASIGVWLFYVQHQFENTVWDGEEQWSFHDAALYGSSHYDMPAVLRWFSANIGIHHVHHLASRIPFYRLGEVLRDLPALGAMSRVTLRESLRCVALVLWDEDKRRLVSFRQARA
ncbi:MAG TPA: fatty acid desaturase [Allosphingosinicella sp.]